MNTSPLSAAEDSAAAALTLLLALGTFLSSCSRAPQELHRYDLKGKVVAVDRGKGEVVVDHEEIPGYMPPMQMHFTLRDADALKVVEAGDQIQATLVVADTGYWLESPAITKGLPGGSVNPAALAGVEPQPGAEVPDFKLVNQDGQKIRLKQLEGKATLLTFIYTRCPLPDYCPLMSTNFAEVNRELEGDENLRAKTHLLSVTLDPAFDTPQVLRAYGENYVGDEGAGFGRWEFATGDPEEIRRLAEFFGLTYKEESGQIIHSLRTAIIAPDGKLYKIYRGNEWKPAQVTRDIQALLSHG